MGNCRENVKQARSVASSNSEGYWRFPDQGTRYLVRALGPFGCRAGSIDYLQPFCQPALPNNAGLKFGVSNSPPDFLQVRIVTL
jgi:hypothetical protein